MRVSTLQIRVPESHNRANSDNSIIESVKTEGVLEPLIVTSHKDGTFTLVAGHRRLASAIHFGIDLVPIHVIPQEQVEKARALENLDRKPLHPLDEAVEIRTLQSQGYDNNVISAMLGMPLSKVVRRAKLNNLSPKVRKAFQEGDIDAASAEEYSIMELDTQDEIFGEMQKAWKPGAGQVRRAYLDHEGIPIGDCSKALLEYEKPCDHCPKNITSDETLFEGEQGYCRDTECFVQKLKGLMAKEGVTTLYYPEYGPSSRDRILKALKKGKVSAKATQSFYSWTRNKGSNTTHLLKKMDILGNVLWGVKEPEKPKIDPEVSKHKKELANEYDELFKQLPDMLEKMVFEHADAYMSKNHKDERFPDKDERVILAKYIISDSRWHMSYFIRGTSNNEYKALDGADNRRLLAVALFYSALCEDSRELAPKKITQGSGVFLPNTMEIEDLYQLKTSKIRKRILEIKDRMELLLKEYNELEGK